MKILFLMTQSLNRPGGLGRFLPFAKALNKAGYPVEIVTLHENFISLPAAQRSFTKDNIPVRYVGQMHIGEVKGEKIYFSPLKLLQITALGTLALTWQAIRSDAQVIQVCKAQPMNCAAAWLAHMLSFGRKQVIVDCDDYEAGNNRFGGGWQQKIVAFFENSCPRYAKTVFVGNSFIKNHFLSLGYRPNQFMTLYNGVDKDRFEPADSEQITLIQTGIPFSKGSKLLVYIGSISLTSHGLDLLIESFCQLKQKRSDVNLLILGDGEDSEQIRHLITEKGLSNNVKMMGRVDPELVPVYFQLADLSIDPRPASVAAESSISMKMIESIVAGTPCVTADIGDLKLVGGESVVAVSPGNPSALAETIDQLLNDNERIEQLKAAAQIEKAAHYWESKIESIRHVYQ